MIKFSSLIFFASSFILLSACGKDVNNEGPVPPVEPPVLPRDSVAIKFAQSEITARGVAARGIISDNLIKNSTISLYGYSNDGGNWNALNVFDNQPLLANGAGELGYSPIKYYDVDGTISYDFYAHFPALGSNGITAMSDDGSGVRKVAIDCSKQPDVLWAATTGILGGDKNLVNFSFTHQLAQIKVIVVSSGYIPTVQVVKGLNVIAINSAVLNMDSGVVEPASGVSAEEVALPNVTDVTVSDTPQQVGEIMMLPVQDISQLKITIAGFEGGADVVKTVPVSNLVLEAGKLTAITITFSTSAIGFTQSVKPWEEGGTPGTGDVEL